MKKEKTLRDEVFKYVKKQYGTDPDYPWKNDYENAVLRHRENKKWYGLVMEVSKQKLRLGGEGRVDVINVKCDPIMLGSLLENEGYLPAYHMSKTSWITILLDGTVKATEIFNMIDISFRMTKAK